MSVNRKMTEIADAIRTLSGTPDLLDLDDMNYYIGEANTEVSNQTDLIAQIATALEGKAAGGGSGSDSGGASVETCTVTIKSVEDLNMNPIPPYFYDVIYYTYVDGAIEPCHLPISTNSSVTITDVVCGSLVSYFSYDITGTQIDGGFLFHRDYNAYIVQINGDATITNV